MNALLTGVLLSLTLAPAADEVTLRWKLAKGDSFYTKTTTKLDQTMTVNGNDMSQNQNQVTVNRYDILKVSDSETIIKQTIVRTDVDGNIPGTGDVTKKLKGAVLTFTLDKGMKVKKVEGFQEMLDKIADGNDQVAKVLKASITEDTYKMGIEELFRMGTDKPLAVGDTWKRAYDLPLGPLGQMEMNAKYKYVGTDGKFEKVTFEADAKYGAPKNGEALGEVAITKSDLKAESFTGTYLFDNKKGRLSESTTDMKMNGSITVKAGGMEIEVGMKQKVKTATTISDTNPVDD